MILQMRLSTSNTCPESLSKRELSDVTSSPMTPFRTTGSTTSHDSAFSVAVFSQSICQAASISAKLFPSRFAA